MTMVPISTIHLVDGDDAMRHSLALLLGVFGHHVVEHAGAATLLEEPGRLSGCIVADLRMPDIDGLEMLARLRSAGATVPVVMMTGRGDIPTTVSAMCSSWSCAGLPIKRSVKRSISVIGPSRSIVRR